MNPTPQEFFLNLWTVTDSKYPAPGVHPLRVTQGQKMRIGEDGEGRLRFDFPEGACGFGDGKWDDYRDLEYDATRGVLTCKYDTKAGPVTAEFYPCLRCRVIPDGPGPHPREEQGEWTAEEEGGP